MQILITPKAQKQISKLPRLTQMAIINKIRSLARAQENLQISKLVGYKDIYRVRVADYRIVYQNTRAIITIILVKHRRDVYKDL